MDDKHKHLPDLFDQRFREMVKAVDSFFDESIKQVNHFFQQSTIPVEVFESDKEVTIESYLPNVKREQIRIDRSGNQLRIRVEDRYLHEVKDDEAHYYNRSHSISQKERVLTLPFAVADTASSASLNDDVLTIVFPKRQSSIDVIDVDDH
ncbi:Molecular chaperone IbpA, HSP20 family [Halobacillus karajensis]|uniref:Hsp20/alpha crystallin family protein n=1 Tax=Halobacillus karajensis TaxID=195088 RepID=UPI0008A72B4A|nr:Hsp20/alpha crystallin family protein [Halobacillus karajensis]SEH72262.1 Molecular chaperone IbpA, HSP20 family [Halobacillus karajensis]